MQRREPPLERQSPTLAVGGHEEADADEPETDKGPLYLEALERLMELKIKGGQLGGTLPLSFCDRGWKIGPHV